MAHCFALSPVLFKFSPGLDSYYFLDWQIHIEIFAFKGNKFIIPFDLEI
jgi:hypothetical protein